MSRNIETPLGTLTPTNGAWIALAVIAVIYPFTVGNFLLFLGASILALGLYGASFDLIYGYTGLLSFGHAVFYGVGAYAATFAIQDYGQGVLTAMLVGFLITAIIAIGLGLIAIRVSSHGFVIVTILIVLIANLAALSLTSITGGDDGMSVIIPELALPMLGEFSMLNPMFRYFFVLAVVGVSLVAMNRLVNSPIGLVFRMVRDNEQRAQLLGYNVTVYKLIAFSVSGAFAGLAGVLSMYVTGFVSASHFALIVSGDAVIYTLVGGRATLIGAILGAVLIEGASNFVSGITDVYPLIIGAILLFTVIFEPEGLVGMSQRVRDWLQDRGVLSGAGEPEPPADPDADTGASTEVTTDE